MFLEDLEVHKRLYKLALEVYRQTLEFPNFEKYELGSQLRGSSNSIPANLSEGFNNKHTNIYLECISRVQGELRETKVWAREGFIQQYEKINILSSVIYYLLSIV